MRPQPRLLALAALTLVAVASCRQREEGLFITAPFNDETRIAKVEAKWEAASGGYRFEVRVENRLADGLYVRLAEFALRGRDGARIAVSSVSRACVVPPRATRLVMSGEVPGDAAVDAIVGFDVVRFAVPLSQRGRGIYREFALQQQLRSPAEVDAEIAGYLATPTCE